MQQFLNIRKLFFNWQRLRFLLLLSLALSYEVYGEIKISRISIGPNSKEIGGDLLSTERDHNPIEIPTTAQSLEFQFSENDEKGRITTRLRYRLEGYDQSWRDLPFETGAKISIQFTDSGDKIVGTKDFKLEGETPGWRGSLEDSDFLDARHIFTTPKRAVAARIIFYGPIGEAAMGILALAQCTLTATEASTGEQILHDLSVKEGDDLEEELGTPKRWSREGSSAGMAILYNFPEKQPHPLLMISDTDPYSYALWATDRNHRIPMTGGQLLELRYKIAHSIGSSGTGIANYPKLEPGRYRFRVAAARTNGELTGEEISLPIDVVPPFYQTWEFWVTTTVISLLGVTWIRRIVAQRLMQNRLAEIEQEQALEHERSRIARDLHDDIGARLTEIAMQSDLVKQDLSREINPNTIRRIESVCSSAIGLTRSVDEIVWAVNPENDTLDHFVNYLSQTAEEFLDAAGIRIRFRIPTELPPVSLSGKMRHNLFLVVREALNNIVKHTKSDLVTLEIQYKEKALTITVIDNGSGFVPSELTPSPSGAHRGLTNIKQRMEEIGGSHKILSEQGVGTRVEVNLPLR